MPISYLRIYQYFKMANLIQISGRPATGKTVGVMSLDPKTTFYINADEKELPWAG